MAVTFVNWGTEGSAASGNVTPGLPVGLAANDVLICIAHTSDQGSMSMDAAWTSVVQGNGGGTTSRLGVWRHIYDGSTDPARLITHTGGQSPIAAIMAFRGVDTTTPVDVTGTINGGTDASIEHNSVTVVTDYSYLLLINGSADDNARTRLSDYGVALTDSASGSFPAAMITAAGTPDGSIACFYRPVAAGATGSIAVTQAASDAWASVQIALRPASNSPIVQVVPFNVVADTLTLNFHKPPITGNSIIAMLSGFRTGGQTWTTVGDSEGNSYNADRSQGQGDLRSAIYSAHNISVSGAFSMTIDPANTGNEIAGVIVEVSGLLAAALDQTGASTGTTTGDNSVTAGGANAQANELVMALASLGAADTFVSWQSPSGYTALGNFPNSNDFVAYHAAGKITSAGETSSATWAHDNTSQVERAAVIATYKFAAPITVDVVPGAIEVAGATGTVVASDNQSVVVVPGAAEIAGATATVAILRAYWSATNKSGDVDLSNGNLTATHHGGVGDNASGRSDTVIEGKRYWEITIDQNTNVSSGVGIANASETYNIGQWPGEQNDSVGFYPDGSVYFNWTVTGTTHATGYPTFDNGDVVGVAVDEANGKIWIRVNGGNWNNSGTDNPATNTGGLDYASLIGGGDAYAAYNVHQGGSQGQITANFGAFAFEDAAPSGFIGLNEPSQDITVDVDPGAIALDGALLTVVASDNQSVTVVPGAAEIAGATGTVTVTDHQRVDVIAGAAEIAGATATVETTVNVFVTAVPGVIEVAGATATVEATANVFVDVTAGAIEVAGATGTVTATDHKTVDVVAGAAELDGATLTVEATANVFVDVVPGDLALDGATATVEATANIFVTAVPGAIEVAGATPTVEATANIFVDVASGAIEIAGATATVETGANTFVDVVAGALAVDGSAPTVDVTTDTFVNVVPGAAEISGATGTVETTAHVFVTAVPGAAEIAGATLTVDTGAGVFVDVIPGSAEITGSTATVETTADVYVTAVPGAVAIDGAAPTVEATQNVLVPVVAGAVEIAGATATVETGNSLYVDVIAGAIEVAGALGTVEAEQDVYISVAPGAIALDGAVPTVVTDVAVTVDPGEIEITGSQPTVHVTDHIRVDVIAGSIVVQGFAGVVTATANQNINVESGQIAIEGAAPTVEVGESADILVIPGMIVIGGAVATVRVVQPTPAERTIAVDAERRTITVANENRTVAVDAEVRVVIVSADSRSIIVDLDDRDVDVSDDDRDVDAG